MNINIEHEISINIKLIMVINLEIDNNSFRPINIKSEISLMWKIPNKKC